MLIEDQECLNRELTRRKELNFSKNNGSPGYRAKFFELFLSGPSERIKTRRLGIDPFANSHILVFTVEGKLTLARMKSKALV